MQNLNFIKYIVIFFSILLISCSSITEEHFILPEGFKGEVTVVYEEPCGIKIEKNKDNVYVYSIPKSGILIVNMPMQCNTEKRKYFYKNAEGVLTEIPVMWKVGEERHWSSNQDPNDPDRKVLGVYMVSCGYKIDNGYSKQSASILNYNELQDSLSSDASYMGNFKRVVQCIKDCESK